jgi:hypothetical protein
MPTPRNMIIQYQTQPSTAQENTHLVEAVFDSLADLRQSHLSYTAYRLADGVNFVHVARFGQNQNPLTTVPAFAEFQRDLLRRCVARPAPTEATVVGSYASTE